MRWWERLFGSAVVRAGADLPNGWLFNPNDDKRVRYTFFYATFTVMGHIAKADGRVCEDEIQRAEGIMGRMGLVPDQRRIAIDLFERGKHWRFSLDRTLILLRRACDRRGLLTRFIEIQLEIALAGGALNSAQHEVFERIARVLDFSRYDLRRLEQAARERLQAPEDMRLRHAFEVLSLPADASDEQITREYRRLISRHHPDRLVARGAPDDEVRAAAERAREIRTAFEAIRQARRQV